MMRASLSLFHERPHTRCQQFITFSIEMELVCDEQVRSRLAVWAQRHLISLNVFHTRRLFHISAHQRIQLFCRFCFGDTRYARRQADEYNLSVRQLLTNRGNEIFEFIEDSFRRFARVQLTQVAARCNRKPKRTINHTSALSGPSNATPVSAIGECLNEHNFSLL